MDIMNNMTVSTSKLTFSLIAITALLVSASGFMIQDAYGLNAPEFTATHLNTTFTKVTFDQNVNGTLRILDWSIMYNSTTAAGVSKTLTEVAISDLINGTTTSGTYTEGGDVEVTSFVKGVAHIVADDKTYSGIGGTNTGLGFINTTDTFYIVHAAIPVDATYFVNYTNNAADDNLYALGDAGAIRADVQGGLGAGATAAENIAVKYLKIGSNATATDQIHPSVVSAEILKSNPNQIIIKFNENIANVNATSASFSITMTSSLQNSNAAVPAFTSVGLNGTEFIYINLQNPASPFDVMTISHNMAKDGSSQPTTGNGGFWITDATNSLRHGGSAVPTSENGGGVGNRIGNFTVSITNWLEIGMYGDVTTCYDCSAPTVTKVEVSLDSSDPITVNDNNQVHINAGIDDTVSVMVTVADNLGADNIPFAGLYTNFGETPDNLYYANNFDSAKQMSTSYYEWNVRSDNVVFDNDGAITWTDATAKVNPDRTQTFTYTMTINDAIQSSQVWVDIGDKSGNYAKVALPITLEVSGAPGLTFASDDTQKVVSFFNESILLAIVSQWAATSSDDASNVEQLSSVLGIESQLPTWTTELASWVADDKIDVADMIVAVEYVINL
jgi:ribose 5-phosphate isomerase RpiB